MAKARWVLLGNPFPVPAATARHALSPQVAARNEIARPVRQAQAEGASRVPAVAAELHGPRSCPGGWQDMTPRPPMHPPDHPRPDLHPKAKCCVTFGRKHFVDGRQQGGLCGGKIVGLFRGLASPLLNPLAARRPDEVHVAVGCSACGCTRINRIPNGPGICWRCSAVWRLWRTDNGPLCASIEWAQPPHNPDCDRQCRRT
jgi:hypothetical protein